MNMLKEKIRKGGLPLFKELKEKVFAVFTLTSATLLLHATPIAAAPVTATKLFTGFVQLIQDLTKWMVGIAAVIGAVLIIYFLARRSSADDMDQKKWENRIKVAVISVIGIVTAQIVITAILSYFQ